MKQSRLPTMGRWQFRGPARSARRTLAAAVVLGLASSFIPVLPAATSPLAAGDVLSGTWQIQRTCVTGCTGSTTATERVRPYRGAVFMASGTSTLVLYRIAAKKVLVHDAKSSSLLTIRTPGGLMHGFAVTQSGSTLSVTWRCVAAAGIKDRQSDDLRSVSRSNGRGIC